jgi:hypothetical protein
MCKKRSPQEREEDLEKKRKRPINIIGNYEILSSLKK